MLKAMVVRNIRIFFKDKAMFFASLVTPMILLVLYSTFLGNVYTDSLTKSIPEELGVTEKLIDGAVAGQLLSSILAVCCVTVAFCSNLLMVQDKLSGARKDITVAPVKNSVVSLSYYIATVVSTMIVCFTAMAACLLYVRSQGWYMSAADIGCIAADVVLLTLFGTALSSIVNLFLATQGQISAVSTIVSAGYGFLCGAYMPISNFGSGLQKVLSFLPGTYGTSLLRNHALRGVFAEMSAQGAPEELVDSLMKAMDCRLRFFENEVTIPAMYLYLAAAVAALVAVYVMLGVVKERKSI